MLLPTTLAAVVWVYPIHIFDTSLLSVVVLVHTSGQRCIAAVDSSLTLYVEAWTQSHLWNGVSSSFHGVCRNSSYDIHVFCSKFCHGILARIYGQWTAFLCSRHFYSGCGHRCLALKGAQDSRSLEAWWNRSRLTIFPTTRCQLFSMTSFASFTYVQCSLCEVFLGRRFCVLWVYCLSQTLVKSSFWFMCHFGLDACASQLAHHLPWTWCVVVGYCNHFSDGPFKGTISITYSPGYACRITLFNAFCRRCWVLPLVSGLSSF